MHVVGFGGVWWTRRLRRFMLRLANLTVSAEQKQITELPCGAYLCLHDAIFLDALASLESTVGSQTSNTAYKSVCDFHMFFSRMAKFGTFRFSAWG